MTTTVTTTTVDGPQISLDRGYVKTTFGILKIVEVVLDAICFICIASTPYNIQFYIPASGWYYFVCCTGFWCTLISFIFCLVRIEERLIRVVPWRLGELIFCALWCFFYMTAAAAVAYYAATYFILQGWFAATFFGFAAMIVYGYDFYLRLQEWRGTRIVTTVRTTTTTTA